MYATIIPDDLKGQTCCITMNCSMYLWHLRCGGPVGKAGPLSLD